MARHALRPAARRKTTWHARIVCTCVFAFVGAWAAAAPQASLGLCERLRMGFDALLFICVALAATSGLRRSAGIIDDPEVSISRKERALARLASAFARAAQDVIPALPVFTLLCALQVISPAEFFGAVALVSLMILAASAIASIPISLLLILATGFLFTSWGRNAFEKAICALVALHLAAKAFILWQAISHTHRLKQNLMDEAVTGLETADFVTIHRARLRRQFGPFVFTLAAANLVFLGLLMGGVRFPVTLEQKLGLGLALASGAVLLFIDASALAWRGILSGATTRNIRRSFATIFTIVIGIPWAAAWLFSALHAGEAVTLNETAAYFILWISLGCAISSFARATAKEKLERDFRHILAEQ